MIASVVVSPEEPAPPAPRFVWHVTDRDAPLGALVIDDLVAGRACGGIRVASAVTLPELRELAATMTLKFAFFGIACGGAKAGVVVPDGTPPDERERRMRAFGAGLAPLARCGTYIAGTDLGCSERDLWEIVTSAGLPAGPSPTGAGVDTCATATASGRSAAIAAITALGGDASGATLGILGYGRVGAAVAARFAAAGGKLVGISTARGALLDPAGLDVAALERLRLQHGDEALLHYAGGRRVDPADLLGAGFDVLSPCATTAHDRCRERPSRALPGRVAGRQRGRHGGRGDDARRGRGDRHPRLRRERGRDPDEPLLAAPAAGRSGRSAPRAPLPGPRRDVARAGRRIRRVARPARAGRGASESRLAGERARPGAPARAAHRAPRPRPRAARAAARGRHGDRRTRRGVARAALADRPGRASRLKLHAAAALLQPRARSSISVRGRSVMPCSAKSSV
jgi:hypothetical protein